MKLILVLLSICAYATPTEIIDAELISLLIPKVEVEEVEVEQVEVDVIEVDCDPPQPRHRRLPELPRLPSLPKLPKLSLADLLSRARAAQVHSARRPLATSPLRVPPYSEAEAEWRETRRFVAARLNFQVPTIQQRNYVALLTAIQGISDTMARGASYDEAYAQRNAYLNLGRQVPIQARDIILIKIRNSVQKTDAIRYLLNQVCGPDVSESCDIKVDNAIRNNPRLQAQGALLVEQGVLAKFWNERAVEWVDAARLNALEDYLNRNKASLRPLFVQAVKVIQLEQTAP